MKIYISTSLHELVEVLSYLLLSAICIFKWSLEGIISFHSDKENGTKRFGRLRQLYQ